MNDKHRLEELIKVKDEFKDFIDKLALESIEKKAKKDDRIFFNLDYICAISGLYEKYSQLIPYKFGFDPKEKMPKVFENEKAFMIWTAWRSSHIISQNTTLDLASLKAAAKMEEYRPGHFNPSFNPDEKEKIIKEFYSNLGERGGVGFNFSEELEYWDKKIFPLISMDTLFRWEII